LWSAPHDIASLFLDRVGVVMAANRFRCVTNSIEDALLGHCDHVRKICQSCNHSVIQNFPT
jgi:hypothetical protein